MEYQRVAVSKPQQSHVEHSPESRYWRNFKHPLFVKEYAPIVALAFSPSRPHRYAVTVGTQVQLYSPSTNKVVKSISRFKDTARSAVIRNDGKLLAAADDTGLVQIFDINSRAILRTLSAHRQPTHSVSFSPLSQTQLLSASDDTTVKLWDIPSETVLHSFEHHTDYVRSGQVSPTNPSIIITGSYDRTIKVFDTRSGECELSMGGSEHAQPVEQVRMYPSSTMLLSTSGPILRTWDLVAGGRCLRALSNHQKTITSVCFTSDAKRVLTGSLDRLVKVYDSESFRVLHTMRYPAPVLCLSISPDTTHILAGMSDGTLSIRVREPKPLEANGALETVSEALSSFPHRAAVKIGESKYASRRSKVVSRKGGEPGLRVETIRQRRLRPFDRALKSFKYSAALDAALSKNVLPSTAFALVSELKHRGALQAALSGRDDVLLEPILRLLLKHVTDPRFGSAACEVAFLVLDLYSRIVGQSPLIDSLLQKLQRKVADELRFQQALWQTKGALDMIFASSMVQIR